MRWIAAILLAISSASLCQSLRPGAVPVDSYLGPSPAKRLKFHREDLPGQIIQGVNTRGSKLVRTVPAGVDGNSRDLTTTVRSWYSPELQLAILTIIDDPIQGLRKIEFLNLKRSEPDPRLFHTPRGYSVVLNAIGSFV